MYGESKQKRLSYNRSGLSQYLRKREMGGHSMCKTRGNAEQLGKNVKTTEKTLAGNV